MSTGKRLDWKVFPETHRRGPHSNSDSAVQFAKVDEGNGDDSRTTFMRTGKWERFLLWPAGDRVAVEEVKVWETGKFKTTALA